MTCELKLDGGEIVAQKVDDLSGSRDGEGTHSYLEYQVKGRARECVASRAIQVCQIATAEKFVVNMQSLE